MLQMSAIFQRKAERFESDTAFVEKIVELSAEEFENLRRYPFKEQAFIAENRMSPEKRDDGVFHCLLVLCDGGNDGILIDTQGYNYARYAAFVPHARQILFMEQRYNCIEDLESQLMSAAAAVISSAFEYDGVGPYRALVGELAEKHDFDKLYTPLLADMLREYSKVDNVEILDDELTVSVRRHDERQGETEQLSGRSTLPFSPERTERLLDKALDWIGKTESGAALYNTLKDKIGMTDDEITSASFNLKEHFLSEEMGESSKIIMR